MSTFFKHTSVLITVATLSACGSSSNDEPPTFAAYDSAFATLDADAAAEANTPESGIPPGQVEYEGVARGTLVLAGRTDYEILGDLEMRADFDSDAVTGSITDFVTSDDEAVAGTLDLSDGQVGRGVTAGVIAVDATGTLTDPLGRDVEVDADMLGRLRGADGAFVTGTFDGDLSSTDGTGATITGDIRNGSFAAERDN